MIRGCQSLLPPAACLDLQSSAVSVHQPCPRAVDLVVVSHIDDLLLVPLEVPEQCSSFLVLQARPIQSASEVPL